MILLLSIIWTASSVYCQSILTEITIQKDSSNNFYYKVPLEKGILIGNKLVLLDSCKKQIVYLSNAYIEYVNKSDSLDRIIKNLSINNTEILNANLQLRLEIDLKEQEKTILKKDLKTSKFISRTKTAIIIVLAFFQIKSFF